MQATMALLDRLAEAEELRTRGPAWAPEAEPQIYSVHVVGRRPDRSPVFRRGGRVSLAHGRGLARRFPGVYVRGAPGTTQVWACSLGGNVSPPHRHGGGLMHVNVDLPSGQRSHVWFGRHPPTDFFAG